LLFSFKEDGVVNLEEILVAPCGMNCGLCSGYLAMKHDLKNLGIGMPYCAGCRPRGKQCAFLKKRCDVLAGGRVEYCYECEDFPCRNLRYLDKRYRANYRMSMIENLEFIRDKGMAAFLEKEAARWRCPECGAVICCHNGLCFSCGLEKLKSKKNKYRWGEE
jgi:hypothetical protein